MFINYLIFKDKLAMYFSLPGSEIQMSMAFSLARSASGSDDVLQYSTLSHYGPAKKARPIKAGSHDLYYHINDLNAEKIPAQR